MPPSTSFITRLQVTIAILVLLLADNLTAGPLLDPELHGAKTEKLNVLIASGRWSVEHDNGGRTFRLHNELLTTVLEATGRFRVRVLEDFRGVGPETLSRYDVVIIAREGRDTYFDPATGSAVRAEGLGATTDAALIEFVGEKGHGIVWFHSAAVQEDDWGWPEAFNQIRGAKLSDALGLRRIPRSEMTVRTAEPRHAITEGIESSWYVVGDDVLAGTMMYPGAKVLLEAYDDPSRYPEDWRPMVPANMPAGGAKALRGMNAWNPLAWVNEYGKGRAFTITLGHGLETFRRLPFIVLLARGIEWAATGEVTLDIPSVTGDDRFKPWPYYESDSRHNARWD